jgi:hypothetical protein
MRLLAGTLMVVAAVAVGQPAKVEERKSAPLNEIERGFFLGVQAGFWGTINPPTNVMGSRSVFSPGQAIQLEMGYDIGERVSPSLMVVLSGNRMSSDYFGYNAQKTTSGDYAMIAPGVTVKVRIVGFDDAQDVKRTWIYARLSAAPAFYTPPGLALPLDVFLAGGLGVEYFTRLRHFSIGLEANFNAMVLTQSFGFSVLPSVRYAF